MEPHSHVFLAEDHANAERRTWAVIWLCGVMMALEIFSGLLFGSIALVADGLHMITHAGALLLAALAYRYASRHATDARFTFGTGKLGDLAGFTSAIVLAMIALLIAWEAAQRVFAPVPIAFTEAIPIACLGLVVNIASAWLLSGGAHAHGHHHHGDGHGHEHASEQAVVLGRSKASVEIHEDGVPPRFRVHTAIPADALVANTTRPNGACQRFTFQPCDGFLQSKETIPEPHAFDLTLRYGQETASLRFQEHDHAQDSAHRDNNMRAAVVHVLADAAVSVLVIVGLLLARAFGWLWLDPLAGLIGAVVIASWAYTLVRDTGRILMDMNPDAQLTERLRREIETNGDRIVDLHLWRLGPGHLGAVLSVVTLHGHRPEDYRRRLQRFSTLSHVTIEVHTA